MDKLRVLDLFSGIGGFSLGLERTGGFETVAFCEIDPFCRRVLAKHWPQVKQYDDIRTLTASQLRTDGIAVDVICGGFPCQDISGVGRRAGMDVGTRSGLWSEIDRLVDEIRPQYVIVENVSDLLSGPSERPGGWFGRVLGDLADRGMDAWWEDIPAAAVGAPHRRQRIWLVAYPNGTRFQTPRPELAPTGHYQRSAAEWRGAAAGSLRAANGVPDRVDRTHALGNAVVPQIPELLGRAILESMRQAA